MADEARDSATAGGFRCRKATCLARREPRRDEFALSLGSPLSPSRMEAGFASGHGLSDQSVEQALWNRRRLACRGAG
jgi:hypothetical protein